MTDFVVFLKQLSILDGISFVVFMAGMTILGIWVSRAPANSLAQIPCRRNNVPYIAPFMILFAWITTTFVVLKAAETIIENSDYGQIIQYLLFDAVNLFYGAIILIVAWFCFARRLKGFGFRCKGIFRDLKGAVVNYLAVIPLVLIGLHIVLLVGSLLRPGFEMEVHEGLEAVSGDASLWLRVVVIFSVVVVAPFFEELMFRGLLQTVIGSYLPKPWIAIAVASVMFVLMHMNSTHWLALFGLSCVLGYSYEKSGSLVRPMLIHAIFNGVSVAMTIMAGSPVS